MTSPVETWATGKELGAWERAGPHDISLLQSRPRPSEEGTAHYSLVQPMKLTPVMPAEFRKGIFSLFRNSSELGGTIGLSYHLDIEKGVRTGWQSCIPKSSRNLRMYVGCDKWMPESSVLISIPRYFSIRPRSLISKHSCRVLRTQSAFFGSTETILKSSTWAGR